MKKVYLLILTLYLAVSVWGQSESTAVLYIDCRTLAPGQTLSYTIDDISLGNLSREVEKIEIPLGLSTVSFNLITPARESTGFNFSNGNQNMSKNSRVISGSNKSFSVDIFAEGAEEYFIKINCILGSCELLDNAADAKKIAKIQKKFGDIPASKMYFAHLQKKGISVPSVATPIVSTPQRVLSDVDKNIPVTGHKAENTFVLIIANENYTFVDKVDFALNDGKTFKEYCIKTLGVPENQVWLYEDASYGIINSGISKMVKAMNLFTNPHAIVYYCGHGIPDEKTGDAYIIPTDGDAKDMATCYSLNTLYTTFANTQAGQITYFMDACFTGANKEGSMLVAARGVAREPKKETLSGKSVVFSATSADETAMAYKEKQHGLFTYFLLKKLQETKGDVSYADLHEYINASVQKESFLTNNKPQTPVVATSPAVQDSWKGMTLK